jgi:CheY-like chemotaxis protein
LAEDNHVNQIVAVRILEKMGHSVVVANHSLEALSLLAQQTFDLVLMDIQMPEMDGLTATKKIREGEAGNTLGLSEVQHQSASEMLNFVKQQGLEGVVAKRADSINQPGHKDPQTCAAYSAWTLKAGGSERQLPEMLLKDARQSSWVARRQEWSWRACKRD